MLTLLLFFNQYFKKNSQHFFNKKSMCDCLNNKREKQKGANVYNNNYL